MLNKGNSLQNTRTGGMAENKTTLLFSKWGTDGSGEECQHLCWGYFLFYGCFLGDASECCGESPGPSLSASCLSTWAGDTKPDIVFKSSHRKLIKRQYDFVFFLLPLVSFCSYIHVYDLALCSYDIMRSIWLLYKYPHVFLLYNKYWGYYYKTQHWSCNCFVTKLYWHDLKGVAVVKKRGTTDQNKLLTLYWQSLNFPLQGQTVCWHGLQFLAWRGHVWQ